MENKFSFGQLREMASWRREKLDPNKETEWTEEDTEKLRELTGIKEIESAEILRVLPKSDLAGLHIVMNQDNSVDAKDFVNKVLGNRPVAKKAKILNKYSFLIIDNIDLTPYFKKATFLNSNSRNQKLHKEGLGHQNLFHPSLDVDAGRARIRKSPTLFADAKLFYDFFVDKLSKYEFDVAKYSTPNERLVVEFIKENIEHIKNGSLDEEEQEYLDSRIFPIDNGVLQKISDQFIAEGNAYAHNWKEKQWLINNDDLVVHGKGGTEIDDALLVWESPLGFAQIGEWIGDEEE